jgi:hypothetical protein
VHLLPNWSLYLNYLFVAVRLCVLKCFMFTSFDSLRAFYFICLSMATDCFMLHIWCWRLFYTFVVKWEFGIWITHFWQCVLKVLIFNRQIFTLLLCVWLVPSCHDDRLVWHCVYKMCAMTILTFFFLLIWCVMLKLNFVRFVYFKMSHGCKNLAVSCVGPLIAIFMDFCFVFHMWW